MQLLKLSVENFGVFRGQHSLDFQSISQSDGILRNLTIVSGHNGSGKSTLFQAIALALYGPLALGDRVSQKDYQSYLFDRLHRYSEGDSLIVSNEGKVALSFLYTQAGSFSNIEIERCWRRDRNEKGVKEELKILRDGKKLKGVVPEDYQIWLNDIVSPGFSPVCFFDAEKLKALSSQNQLDSQLGETIQRLLGLDLVERLQSDLAYWVRRQGGGKNVEKLRKEVFQEQNKLNELRAQLERVRNQIQENEVRQSELAAKLKQQERRLASEGGRYAARRPVLKNRLMDLEKEIEGISGEFYELCAGLLPFALAPQLCKALNNRLEHEENIRRRRAANQIWQGQLSEIEQVLEEERIWEDIQVSEEIRQVLTQRFKTILEDHIISDKVEDRDLIHHLAKLEKDKLQNWITLVLNSIPKQSKYLGQRLQKLQTEREKIKDHLSRAPEDEVLAPLHEEIMYLENVITELGQEQFSLKEQVGKLEFQIEEQKNQLERVIENLKEAQANQRQLELAERSEVALQVYQDALTRQYLALFEEKLVASFNTICRKEHLLTAAQVNPVDFSIDLNGIDHHILKLTDFSAGERQLYTLALLWALRQLGDRELPLVIDTPLARLDEDHRHRLIHNYVPEVSNQVVLFTTDAELDYELLSQAAPYLARVYQLDYDAIQQETTVKLNQHSLFSNAFLYQGMRAEIMNDYICSQAMGADQDRAVSYIQEDQID